MNKNDIPYLQLQTKSIGNEALNDPSLRLWALARGQKGKNTHNPETLPISSCVHPSLASESKERETGLNHREVKTTDSLYTLYVEIHPSVYREKKERGEQEMSAVQ